MTKQEALTFLINATAFIEANRATHAKIQQALDVISEAIKEEKKP